MSKFELSGKDTLGFKKAFDHCKAWATEHQAEIGLAEMALGASIIALGLYTGQIDIGQDVVATKLSSGGLTGGGVGAGFGGIGAALLGSIGVAGAVTFGIPAAVLTGGGMLVFGLAGYGAGDLAQKLLSPETGISDLVAGGSMLLIGTVLMVDGARRVVTDARVLQMASRFMGNVLSLVPMLTRIVARTADELKGLAQDLLKPAPLVGATACVVGSAAIGSSVAAGSVTVLGSHALGSAAMAMGLVSAPVWPVIAAGAGGLALWKGIQYLCSDQ